MNVPTTACRLRLVVRGAVQGVGFRPFVFRLATELGLAGWVNNSPLGVQIEVEGARSGLEKFLLRLPRETPPNSSIQSLEAIWLDAAGFERFEIRPSESGGERQALVLPDIATCPHCLAEICDPANRRFAYAFTNCTHCGPRFSIIESLPYDRANTTMRGFAMCPDCRAEYENPADRRFHAQPNACPQCGPQLQWWDASGTPISESERRASLGPNELALGSCRAMLGAPLAAAVSALRAGAIVAVKGIGGFHLMCLAGDDAAVRRLRERKRREEKPFAVMFPSLDAVRDVCEFNELEARALASSEAPIVLLVRRNDGVIGQGSAGDDPHFISPAVAPGNPLLGVLLPSNPLHHLLLRELAAPVVATSGNLSYEPICTDEREAVERLHGIADFFLVHNRPIARPVDDSIVRVVAGRELVLRRARGFAPLPVKVPGFEFRVSGSGAAPAVQLGTQNAQPETILAVGAHLKNTVALAVGDNAFVSQHLGDLESEPAFRAFERAAADLPALYHAAPQVVACDAHPDYLSTKFAERLGLPVFRVQHHVAHTLACMAENEIEPPALGVAWDGTGFGLDGTVWGGEFFIIGGETSAWNWRRFAHLRTFPLPGGEAAVREPRRAALGLLFAAFGNAAFEMPDLAPLRAFNSGELAVLRQSLTRSLNCPLTSSAGRLFDAVAALCGLRQVTRFEGQSALALEFAAGEADGIYDLRFAIYEAADAVKTWRLDWQPLVEGVVADVRAGVAAGVIAAKFHAALAAGIVEVARRAGVPQVALGGGCFQNRRLLEAALARLTSAGFRPYWPQRIPPNDGGIALGQVVAARQKLNQV